MAHRHFRRSTRPRRTTASTRPTFTIPPRDLFRCVTFPSSLPTSLADALLDALALAAFYRAAAVLSAATWRDPDQISEVEHHRGMFVSSENGPMLFFYPVVTRCYISWKPVGRLVTINPPQCYLSCILYLSHLLRTIERCGSGSLLTILFRSRILNSVEVEIHFM